MDNPSIAEGARPKSALEIMLGDWEPWPSPSGLFVGPPTPMQDMARRWLAEVVELALFAAAETNVKRFVTLVEA
jgi:hypothetical protein